MSTNAAMSQPTGLVFGLLSLTANEKKPLTDAVFSALAAAPNHCRGVTIQLRSGALKLIDEVDATDGWTLAANVPFGDLTAANLTGWYVMETAGGAAVLEIVCRTGGVA
jgi:hypothetical protein